MDGYQEEGLTYADLNPQTIYLTDGLRCRKTDSGYVLEAMGSDEEWHAITGGGGGAATLGLTSTGDVTIPNFTADNSGIKQVDVNDVPMLSIWSGGNFDFDGSLYIGDTLPAGLPASQDNLAIGFGAMAAAATGETQASANTALGYNALGSITTGADNIAIGTGAGQSIEDGTNNVVIGRTADVFEPSGSQMTLIGSQVDSTSGVTENGIGIGYLADVTTDNTAVIGNSAITDVYFGSTSGNAILHGKGDAIVFPDADPHVDGAAYWDSGNLVRSNG